MSAVPEQSSTPSPEAHQPNIGPDTLSNRPKNTGEFRLSTDKTVKGLTCEYRSTIEGTEMNAGAQWEGFLPPGQKLPDGFRIIDKDGSPVDLLRATLPTSVNGLRLIDDKGRTFKLHKDAWGKPCIFSIDVKAEHRDAALAETLENVISLWDAALRDEAALESQALNVLGPVRYQHVKSVFDLIAQSELIQRKGYELRSLDLPTLVQGEMTRSDLLSFLVSHKGLGTAFEGSAFIEDVVRAIEQMRTGSDITPEAQITLDVLRLASRATRPLLHNGEDRFVTNENRTYALANVTEDVLCRDACGEEPFSIHQRNIAEFRKRMTDAGFEVPEFFDAFISSDFRYSIAVDRRLANAAGDFFITENFTSADMAHTLTHERVHHMRARARVAGSDEISRRERETGTKIDHSREFIDETFTEALASIIDAQGDIQQAQELNFLSKIAYRSGVAELLDILQEIQLDSQDPLMGAKVLLEGLRQVSMGNLYAQSQVAELYYDRHIAKREGAFRERMEGFRDNIRVPASVPKVQLPAEMKNQYEQKIDQVIKSLDWDSLTAEERESLAGMSKADFEDWKLYKIALYRQSPQLIFFL